MGDLAEQRLGHREGRSEHHAGLRGHRLGQRPLLGQKAPGGGLLVVMDQRQASVLQGQHAGGYGHLESGIQRLSDGVRQTELTLYVQAAGARRQLYGLVHGIYLLDAVVARRGLHDADNVLVYLLRAPLARDGLYHVLAGEDLVEVGLAEHFVPGAGRAARYARDRYRVEVEAELLGEARLIGRKRGLAGGGRRGHWDLPGGLERPVLVIGVEEFPAPLRHLAVPVHRDAKRRHVGEQVVEFGDAATFRVVGSEYGDRLRLVLERRRGKRAEHSLRAAFYESAHALVVHAFKLLYELHRARHLLDQHVVDALRVRREEVGGHVG